MVGNALKVLPFHLGSPTLPQAPPPTRPPPASSPHPDEAATTHPVASTSSAPPPASTASPASLTLEEVDDDILPAPAPNPAFVPWHRVLAASGVISPRGSLAAVVRQADFLRAEGVEVAGAPVQGGGRGGNGVLGQGGVDGGRVSMAMYRWDGGED